MMTNSVKNLSWKIRNIDAITGWMELQPLETLVWQKKEIPEYALNSSFLVRWLCESLESFLPEESVIDETESWAACRNEDELEFHPVLFVPCDSEMPVLA